MAGWVRAHIGLPAGMVAAAALATVGVATAGPAGGSVSRTAVASLPSSGSGTSSRAAAGRQVASLPPQGYGTGTGYCTGHSGGVTSSYSYNDVYACKGSTTGVTTFDNPGPHVYAWQCVELSARYLWAVHGIWAGPGTGVQDGADLVSVVHASHAQIPVGSPGPGSVPVAGDVVSMGPGGPTDPTSGHTAVVISSSAATGSFTVMSQNWPDGTSGEQTWHVDVSGGHNGKAAYNGSYTTVSWLKLKPALGYINTLRSVAALSPSDAWAAGWYCTSSCYSVPVFHGLMLHWNGAAWSRVSIPRLVGLSLSGVTALSPTNAWAVGGYEDGGVILHWNGTAWSKAASLNSIAGLSAISARSANNAWAVGYGLGLATTVTVHWNGTRWSEVKSPNPGKNFNGLTGVSAYSATDAWAVGLYCKSSCSTGYVTAGLLLHWNGTAWSKSALPVTNSTGISGVDALSATDAWAVGTTASSQLIMHWNGAAWSKVAAPLAYPNAIGFSSPASGWAVGGPAFLRWDGAAWKQVTITAPSSSSFYGISMDNATDGWAVGTYCASKCSGAQPQDDIIAMHWNGKTWVRS